MTSKFIKLPAVQGISTVAQGQLLDFDIPDYGFMDLSKSYISLIADIATTETAGADAIHSVFVPTVDGTNFKNSALVSDYFIRNSRVGDLENVLESNVMNGNLQSYSRDFEQVESDNYKTFCQAKDAIACQYNDYNTAFRRLYQGRQSQNVKQEIKIKLSDLSPMCNQIPLWDGQKMGPTRLEVKWDADTVLDSVEENLPYNSMYSSIVCNNAQANTNAVVITQKVIDADDLEVKQGDNVLLTYTATATSVTSMREVTAIAIAAQVASVTVDGTDVPTGASSVSIVKALDAGLDLINPTTDLYVDSNATNYTVNSYSSNIDYYLGKTISIVYPGANNNIIRVDKLVTSVQVLPTGRLRLGFSGALATAATNKGKAYLIPSPPMTFNAVDATFKQFTITGMKLQDLQLWVGGKIRITGVTGGGSPTKVAIETLITSIVQSGADVVVTVADALTNVATDLRYRLVPAASLALTFSNPTLVMKQLYPGNVKLGQYMKAAESQMTFTTYSTERVTIPSNSYNYNRIFDCPMGCQNGFFLVVKKSDTLLSNKANIAKYRLMLNDKYVTNRDIVPFDPLYTDQIVQTSSTSALVNLRSLACFTDANDDRSKGEVFTPCVMLEPGQFNRVQLSLYFENGSGNNEYVVYFVKEMTHTLSVGKSVNFV